MSGFTSWLRMRKAKPWNGRSRCNPSRRTPARAGGPIASSPGDKVSIEYHPLKDGSRGGQLTAAVLANGKRLGPPPPDGFLSVTPGDGGI